MWHEVYAPKTINDVCWSRQKINEFSSLFALLQSQRNACVSDEVSVQQSNIMLCYGPTGCAKTSSIEVILPEITASEGLDLSDTSLPQVPALHSQKRNCRGHKKSRDGTDMSKPNKSRLKFTTVTLNLEIIDGLGNSSDDTSESILGYHPTSDSTDGSNFTFLKSRRGAGTVADLQQDLFKALDRQQTYMEGFLQRKDPTVIHSVDNKVTVSSTSTMQESAVLCNNIHYGRRQTVDFIEDVSSDEDNVGQHNQTSGEYPELSLQYKCNVVLIKELPQCNNGFFDATHDNLDKVLCSFLESSRRQEETTTKVREKIRRLRDLANSLNTNERMYLHKENGGSLLEIIDSVFVFVHTIHDSHNDKVDLSNWLPRDFFASSSILQFHCRSITTNSILSQLGRVLRLHLVDIRSRENNTIPSRMDRSAWIQELIDGVDENEKEGGKMRLARVPKKRKMAAHPLLVSIAERCNGDVRNAVLQLQWASLCRVTHQQASQSTPSFTESMNSDCSQSTMKSKSSLTDIGYSFARDETIDLSHAMARLLTQKYSLGDILAVLPGNTGIGSRSGGSCPPWKVYDYFTYNMHHYFSPSANDADGPHLSSSSKPDQQSSPIAYSDSLIEHQPTFRVNSDLPNETFVGVDAFQWVTYGPSGIGRGTSEHFSQLDAYGTVSAFASLVDTWIPSPKQFNGYGYGHSGSGEGWSPDNAPINEIGISTGTSSGHEKFGGISVCDATLQSSMDSKTSSITSSFMDSATTGSQYHSVQSYFGLQVLSLSYATYHTQVHIPRLFISLRPPPFMPPCFPISVSAFLQRRQSDYFEEKRENRLIESIDCDDASYRRRENISDLSKYCNFRQHLNNNNRCGSSSDSTNIDTRVILTPYYATIRYLVGSPGATVEEVILDMLSFTALIFYGSLTTADVPNDIHEGTVSVFPQSTTKVRKSIVPFGSHNTSNNNLYHHQISSMTQFSFQVPKPKRTILGPPPGGKGTLRQYPQSTSMAFNKSTKKEQQGVEGILRSYIDLIDLLFNSPMCKISPAAILNNSSSYHGPYVEEGELFITSRQLMLSFGIDDKDRQLGNNTRLEVCLTNFILRNQISTCHLKSINTPLKAHVGLNPRFVSIDLSNDKHPRARLIGRYASPVHYTGHDTISILSTEWGNEEMSLYQIKRPSEKGNSSNDIERWVSIVSDLTGELCVPSAFGVFEYNLPHNSKVCEREKIKIAAEFDEIENSDEEL